MAQNGDKFMYLEGGEWIEVTVRASACTGYYVDLLDDKGQIVDTMAESSVDYRLRRAGEWVRFAFGNGGYHKIIGVEDDSFGRTWLHTCCGEERIRTCQSQVTGSPPPGRKCAKCEDDRRVS